MAKRKILLIAMYAASAAVTMVLYIVLHELGHCIVALACGAKIVEFSVITAHMSSTGGHFTDFSDMWLNANGALFPLVIGAIYAVLYRKDVQNKVYQAFSFVFTLAPGYSLFAWVFIPVLYLMGKAPYGDDCTKFLDVFSIKYSPLLAAAGAIVLIVSYAVLLVKRRTVFGFVKEIKSLLEQGKDKQ